MGSIILGSILVVVSLFGFTYWWWDVVDILRGIIPIGLLILGIVAIGAGLNMVKEEPIKKRKKNEEDED
jgi:hypothetical protein